MVITEDRAIGLRGCRAVEGWWQQQRQGAGKCRGAGWAWSGAGSNRRPSARPGRAERGAAIISVTRAGNFALQFGGVGLPNAGRCGELGLGLAAMAGAQVGLAQQRMDRGAFRL